MASSGTGTTEPTENFSRILWTSASRTTSSSTPGKTKQLMVNFHRHRQPCTQVNIQGMDIEMVTSYKNLGVHLNNKLDWTDHIAATYKKGQSRRYLMRKLRSFRVQVALLTSFYDFVVASATFYGVVCWSSSISAAGKKTFDALSKKASSVLGCPLTQCRQCERAGWWISCHHCWCSGSTPCRSPSLHWAAPSVID